MDRIKDLIEKCRLLEKDHKPDGYPAIQMKDVTLLCDTIVEMIPALDRLQDRLELGAKIEFLSRFYLRDKNDEIICSGESIRELLINLIMVDC